MMPRRFGDRGGGSPHRLALPVAQVRLLETGLMATLPPGTLMQRAATALDVECARLLRELRGRVTGSHVVLLVGAGDNGGDALYAGARLARRGAAVTALLVASRHHRAGAAALRSAGGLLRQVGPEPPGVQVGGDRTSRPGPYRMPAARRLLEQADLVVDGILGIGGRGGLRDAAAQLLHDHDRSGPVVAVDLPSGVDADTGEVPGVAVRAHLTVAMGVLKPGLLLGAGRGHAGEVVVVDIGLPLDEDGAGALVLVDDERAGRWLGAPGPDDDKYTRGAVGVSAGSMRYPGAAVLSTGAARHVAAGFVRYAGPAAQEVVRSWPDVVVTDAGVADAGHVQCWVVGPGRGTDDEAAAAVAAALAQDVPVVLDADALTVLAERREIRAAVRDRRAPTVLTPHGGEFVRLGGGDPAVDRVGAVRALADELAAVVLLKGSTTLVAAAGSPTVYAVTSGPPALATAGSGDVLSGIVGSVLAHRAAAGPGGQRTQELPLLQQVGAAVAAAAYLHGVAGRVAAEGGRSVAALDVLAAVPAAVAAVRAHG